MRTSEPLNLGMSDEIDPENRLIGRVIINVVVPDAFPQKYHAPLIRSAEQCAVAKHIVETLPAFAVDVLTHCEVE